MPLFWGPSPPTPPWENKTEAGTFEGFEVDIVNEIAKRMGTTVRPPALGPLGYELVGGRLLPGEHGPVAQFMYQEATGRRLTLYVSARSKSDGPTAFRFAQEGPVAVFYWIDGNWGYALSGGIDKPALSRISASVYRQLNP